MDINLWMGPAYMLFPELNRVCHCWILERKGSQCRIAEPVFQASKSEGVEEKPRGSFHGGSLPDTRTWIPPCPPGGWGALWSFLWWVLNHVSLHTLLFLFSITGYAWRGSVCGGPEGSDLIGVRKDPLTWKTTWKASWGCGQRELGKTTSRQHFLLHLNLILGEGRGLGPICVLVSKML